MVAAFLLAITVMEVWIFYVPALARVLVPILLILSTLKFALVAMFYMHLRFDHAWYSYVFVGPLIIAVGLAVGAPLALPTTSAPRARRPRAPGERDDDVPLAPGGRARAGGARRRLSPRDRRAAPPLRLGPAAGPRARRGIPRRAP